MFYLLDSRVFGAVFELLLGVDRIHIFHVGDDVLSCVLALRDICQHRWVLRLRKSKLIVRQGPVRFCLDFVSSLDILSRELAPSRFAYDSASLKKQISVSSKNLVDLH